MSRVVQRKYRIEGSKTVCYTVENESYEDEYGIYRIDYVPYRTDDKEKKRMTPATMALSQMDAEGMINFGSWIKCKCCGQSYFQSEDLPTEPPLESSGQPA
jgi:hypothetical protein